MNFIQRFSNSDKIIRMAKEDITGEILKYIVRLNLEGKLKGEGVHLLLHFVATGEDRS